MDRYLVIVSRDRPELVSELRSTYCHAGEVEILLDRRQGLSWTMPGNCADRRATMRLGTVVEGQGFFVVSQLQSLAHSF